VRLPWWVKMGTTCSPQRHEECRGKSDGDVPIGAMRLLALRDDWAADPPRAANDPKPRANRIRRHLRGRAARWIAGVQDKDIAGCRNQSLPSLFSPRVNAAGDFGPAGGSGPVRGATASGSSRAQGPDRGAASTHAASDLTSCRRLSRLFTPGRPALGKNRLDADQSRAL